MNISPSFLSTIVAATIFIQYWCVFIVDSVGFIKTFPSSMKSFSHSQCPLAIVTCSQFLSLVSSPPQSSCYPSSSSLFGFILMYRYTHISIPSVSTRALTYLQRIPWPIDKGNMNYLSSWVWFISLNEISSAESSFQQMT